MKALQQLLCALHLHDWSAWSAPKPAQNAFAALVGYQEQTRHCVRSSCNLVERRSVDVLGVYNPIVRGEN